jgi:hypothetical protein
MSTQALPPVETVEDVFNLLETEITLLDEYLDPSWWWCRSPHKDAVGRI